MKAVLSQTLNKVIAKTFHKCHSDSSNVKLKETSMSVSEAKLQDQKPNTLKETESRQDHYTCQLPCPNSKYAWQKYRKIPMKSIPALYEMYHLLSYGVWIFT